MKSWPRSARITLALTTLFWLVSIVYVKLSTADSYRAVGMNNGSIEARYKLIEDLRAKALLERCADWPKDRPTAALVSVKADQVDLHVNPDGSIRLCEY